MAESVKVFPYPVLMEGNLSFPEGEYEHEFTSGSNQRSVKIEHKLKDCALLERLIAEKKAVYACIVSIPITSYRKLHYSQEPIQEISWTESVLGEPPFIRPLVVSTKKIKCKFTKHDGVNRIWVGKSCQIEKGAKLALGSMYRLASSLQHLISVRLEPSLRKGSFCVDANSNEGFFFDVGVAEDLFHFLKNSGDNKLHRKSIFTHIVSCCFSILNNEFATDSDEADGWESYSNLQALAEELKTRNQRLWGEDGFRPEEAAMAMYPHLIPETKEESEEGY